MKLRALAVVVSLGLATSPAVVAAPVQPLVLKTRPCGYLGTGKGWHVRATANVRCSFARRLSSKFFTVARCAAARQSPKASCAIAAYRCVETYPASGVGLVRCRHRLKLVAARSNP